MTFRGMASVALVALCSPACKGEDETPVTDPFIQALAGTWRGCSNHGSTDESEEMTMSSGSGSNVNGTDVTRRYATTNTTCGGTATSTSTNTYTAAVGGNVSATFRISGATVTAHAVDVTMAGGGTFYSILYIDAAKDPDLLYTGDDPAPGDPAHDGSTPAKRHIILDDGSPLAKQ